MWSEERDDGSISRNCLNGGRSTIEKEWDSKQKGADPLRDEDLKRERGESWGHGTSMCLLFWDEDGDSLVWTDESVAVLDLLAWELASELSAITAPILPLGR